MLDAGSIPENNFYKADSLFSTCNDTGDTGFNAGLDLSIDGDDHVQFDWNDFSGVLSTMDNNIYSSLMDWEGDLSAMGTKPFFDSSELDVSSNALHNGSTSSPTSHASASASLTGSSSLRTPPSSLALNFPDSADGRTSSLTSGHNQSRSESMLPSETGMLRQASSAVSACDCMVRALDLLKTLSRHGSHEMSPSSVTLIAQNKQDIDASLAILACHSCSNDRFVLMISLLITMKILARYASATELSGIYSHSNELDKVAWKSHEERQPTLASDHADSGTTSKGLISASVTTTVEDQMTSRETIQRVLRELHLVQRLIAQLSSRLKSLDAQESGGNLTAGLFTPTFGHSGSNSHKETNTRIRTTSMSSVTGTTGSTPLSARTLDLVEDDVRKSLSALSAFVRGALKNS
jgi:hypothetical protein